MKYIPTHKSMEESWALSADLWAQVSGRTDGTTQYLVAPREHPESGDVYFYMDESQAEALGLDIENAIDDWPVVEEQI